MTIFGVLAGTIILSVMAYFIWKKLKSKKRSAGVLIDDLAYLNDNTEDTQH